MSTIEDVAKLAHVSKTTVFRVLSKKKYVSEQTREKVLQAVKESGYMPIRQTGKLRPNQGSTIAVIIPDISNPYFSPIIKGIQEQALTHNSHIYMCDTGNSEEQEREFIQLAMEKDVDGIILVTSTLSGKDIYQLSKEIPIVLAGESIESSDIPTVTINNMAAARDATKYLYKLGHHRIGFISGPLDTNLYKDRLKGYRQALQGQNLPIDYALIQQGDYTVNSGYEMMLKLLNIGQSLSAVIASNGELAMGAIQACKEKQVIVPEEISIVSLDEIAFSEWLEPQLTTVFQPKYELGKLSLRRLLQAIENGSPLDKKLVLPHQLLQRETTAAKTIVKSKRQAFSS